MNFIAAIATLLVLSTQVQADTCNGLFHDGQIHFATANNTFTAASTDYQTAIQEASKPNPNQALVCSKLLSASALYDGSMINFRDCALTFKAAVDVCVGEMREQADALNYQCTELYGQAQTISDLISENIPGYCN